jgi:hypothetical protein
MYRSLRIAVVWLLSQQRVAQCYIVLLITVLLVVLSISNSDCCLPLALLYACSVVLQDTVQR